MLRLSFAPWGKGGRVSAPRQSTRPQPAAYLQRLPLTTPLPHPHRCSSLGAKIEARQMALAAAQLTCLEEAA